MTDLRCAQCDTHVSLEAFEAFLRMAGADENKHYVGVAVQVEIFPRTCICPTCYKKGFGGNGLFLGDVNHVMSLKGFLEDYAAQTKAARELYVSRGGRLIG